MLIAPDYDASPRARWCAAGPGSIAERPARDPGHREGGVGAAGLQRVVAEAAVLADGHQQPAGAVSGAGLEGPAGGAAAPAAEPRHDLRVPTPQLEHHDPLGGGLLVALLLARHVNVP